MREPVSPVPTPAPAPEEEDVSGGGEKQRTRSPGGFAKWIFVLFTAGAVLLSIHQLFNLQFLSGHVILEGSYLFLLAGFFLSLTFLSFPMRGVPGATIPWYDWILAAASLAVALYFAATVDLSLEEGWEYAPPEEARWLSILFWLLILEATRRAGGLVIFLIVLFFSLYPTFADVLPGPISGFAQPFLDVIPYHILSSESSFGIPMRAFGNLVIGFIIFGAALQFTGGGAFFNNLALALVGGLRGGAAKVAIFASGFMGSLSGSVISNVLTTGAISIPAMKRTGFPAKYAAGTEACASTGGVLMPPVMGTTAFVMASFLGLPYLEIAAAAAVPSILYYLGLFIQIDSYAARHNLKGIPRAQLPSVWETLKEGWYYLFVFALLIFLMMVLRQETWAPFFATGLLLVINQISKKHRFDFRGFFNLVYSIGRGLTELVAVLLGIGLIVGAFSATGLAGTLVNDLIFLAGGSVFMLLVMGAITSFIFGMGMTVTACYIFLAVVLAPALVKAGLDELAVHLFILYWGMVSYITPPVALGAFAAATMARTNALASGIEAMRLGSIIYFVPFFFVLNPALIGRGDWTEVLVVFATAVVGVYMAGSALQGYAAGFGRIGDGGPGALAMKLVLLTGGLFFAAPGEVIPGVSHLQMGMIGAALGAPVLLHARMKRRSSNMAAG